MLPEKYATLASRPAQDWWKEGEKNALQLFHEASRRVPAYRDFLTKHQVKPASIRKIADFANLPALDKDNYLNKYSLAELSWDGKLTSSYAISVSSGSTGAPYFWPRSAEMDKAGHWYAEYAFRYLFEAHRKPTLVVNCLTLGNWIAGMFLQRVLYRLIEQGFPMTMVSPGISLPDIMRVIMRLAPEFEQTVILGYPSFLKDVVDAGVSDGLDWQRFNVKFMAGGEPFRESWRDYVLQQVGSTNPNDFYNMYASADAGIIGTETREAVSLKRTLEADGLFALNVFGYERQPSVQQFNPALRYLEKDDTGLVITANSGVPLVRYRIKDNGGILRFENMKELLPKGSLQLPFVYVYGRDHNTATFYALNVYPENIKAGLEDERIRHLVTGKLLLATTFDERMDQQLEVTVELAQGVKGTAKERRLILEVVVEQMRRLNSEYRRLWEAIGERALPVLIAAPKGDARFRPGAKMPKVESKR